MIFRLRITFVLLLVAGATSLFAFVTPAQVQEKTTAQAGQPTKEVTVERGEVVYVSGNNLLVRMEDGRIRDFPNVPDTARVTVDGKELGVHDLRPGMMLQRTITTTTTPRLVTTTQSVTGTVFQVQAPNWVILTLEDGTNQRFNIPKGQKFNIDGAEVDAFHLRKGMKLTATKVVEVPETQVTQERKVTGQMPPPPSPDTPILIILVEHPQP